MKKRILIIAMAAAIGFVIAACSGTETNGNGTGTNGNGSVVINNNPTYTSPQPFNDITAAGLVANIKIGWNLGNTFDAAGNTPTGFSWLGGGVYANTSVSQMEGAWVNHITTKANIDTIKNAGFNTIRIPVTWYKAANSNYDVRADWMARITEVVNYAVANDMYVILNSHHDETIFKFTNAEMENSLRAFKRIWQHIAVNFMNYDERLIFEGLNEPRTKGAPHEWSGGNDEERANLNRYYQVFVDTIRASGGNNDKRILMINTYAASATPAAMNGLVLPDDTVENKLVVSVHFYEPYNFALNTNSNFNTWSRTNSSDTSAITSRVDRAYDTFVSKGIPVIIGEFGAMNKNNEAVRAEWAEFYVSYAREKGIPCVWWDNGGFQGDGELFGLLNRGNNTFPFPLVRDALMRGAGVN